MVKTASRTQENDVRQISSHVSMDAVLLFPGSVMATTTARIILMNWREYVVRPNTQLQFNQNCGATFFFYAIKLVAKQCKLPTFNSCLINCFSHFLFALV